MSLSFLPRLATATTLGWLLLAVLGGGSVVSGALLAYDGFEAYPAASGLNGGSQGTGWSGNWVTEADHTTVQTATLVDPTGQVGAGLQAARLQPTANLADEPDFITRGFPSTSDTVYLGFLIRNAGGIDSGDFLNFQVSDGATGNTTAALGVGIRNAPGNPFFARVGSSSSGGTSNASTNAAADTTFLLVARFSKDGGSTTYNRTDLFINPADSTEPAVADAEATSGVTGLSSLSLFSVRNFSPEAGDTLFIDELRIASTFADAVPEPSGLFLLMLGAGGLLFRRERGSARGSRLR